MPRPHNSRTRVFKRQPRARDRAWTSMRVMRRFSLPDLVATAEIGRRNAAEYCRGLLSADILRVDTPRRSGVKGGHVIYMLIKDLGPKAPRMQRDGDTYNPNTHSTMTGGISNER